ncbi:MAG: hypothetical protein ACHQT9_03555 [Candidatus Saccharimonadales bacterium]
MISKMNKGILKKRLNPITLLVLIMVLVISVTFLGYIFASHSWNKQYDSMLTKCISPIEEQYAKCIGNSLLSFANQNPTKIGEFQDYVYKNANKKEPIDLRYFSDYSHYVGMNLADKPVSLNQAATFCGNSFLGGCLHGFVMENLDTKNVTGNKLTSFISFCSPLQNMTFQYLNCLHGVGHEFWAKGLTSLNKDLGYCNGLSGPEYKNACWSGIFMEYSKSGKSNGHHLHTKVGVISIPCEQLSAIYQGTCYAAEGSYRQYYPNQEPQATTDKYCKSIPKNYTQVCLDGINTRMNIEIGK